jgi:tetratricopeptide (TPR) repeat protein
MKRGRAVDVDRLQSDVQWALAQGLGRRDLVPMLERLRRHAPPGSEAACFASMELAELLLHENPWAAAVHAKYVLAHVETDRGWAVLGLALALLGHYRSAKVAFESALQLAPACSSYAHNLGHLLDVGLGRPRAALKCLERAHLAEPSDEEIAASYAHALLRSGRNAEARATLQRVLGDEPARVDQLLERWAATPR